MAFILFSFCAAYILIAIVCLGLSYGIDHEMSKAKVKEAVFWPILFAVIIIEEWKFRRS